MISNQNKERNMDKNICILVNCLVVAVIAIIIEKKVEKGKDIYEYK